MYFQQFSFLHLKKLIKLEFDYTFEFLYFFSIKIFDIFKAHFMVIWTQKVNKKYKFIT